VSANVPDPVSNIWRRVQERPVPVVIVVLLVTLFIALAGYPWIWLIGGAVVVAVLLPSILKMGGGQGSLSQGGSVGSLPSIATGATGSTDLARLQGRYHALMERALSTRGRIEAAVDQTQDPGQRQVLAHAMRDLPELTQRIYELACKAQGVQSGLGGANPMEELAEEIKRLEVAMKSTGDEFQKSQYYASLDGKLQQMQNITDATVALQRWDAQIENAVSTLDTLLSQVLRIKSSEVLSYRGSTDDLSSSLRHEVDSLKATAEAMDNVYGWQDKN
jgi:hypothetical protein